MNIFDSLIYTPFGDNETAITITEGDFKGIQFKFGRVWIDEGDNPVLHFDYDVLSDDKPEHKMTFEHTISQILHRMIEKAIDEHTAIYTGGV